MAALADQRAAAARLPALVDRGVGARMALLADHAEDRSARRRQEAPRLLDGGRVHPVLPVAEPHAGGAAGAHDLVRRGERALEHRQARSAGVAEEAGEGLLDDDVLARRRRFHRHRGVQMRRHAQVDHVDLGIVEDGAEVRHDGGRAGLRGERAGALGAHRGHRAQVDRHPVHVPVALRVEPGDEARPHDSHPHPRPLALRHARLLQAARSRPIIDDAIRPWQGPGRR